MMMSDIAMAVYFIAITILVVVWIITRIRLDATLTRLEKVLLERRDNEINLDEWLDLFLDEADEDAAIYEVNEEEGNVEKEEDGRNV